MHNKDLFKSLPVESSPKPFDLLVSISRQDKIFYLAQSQPDGGFLHLDLKKAGVKIHFNRLFESPEFNPDSTLIFYGPGVNLVALGIPPWLISRPFFFHSALPLDVVTTLQLHYFTKCPVCSVCPKRHEVGITDLNANQICRLAKFIKNIPASTPIKIVRSDTHIGISTWVLINGFVVYDLTDYDEW